MAVRCASAWVGPGGARVWRYEGSQSPCFVIQMPCASVVLWWRRCHGVGRATRQQSRVYKLVRINYLVISGSSFPEGHFLYFFAEWGQTIHMNGSGVSQTCCLPCRLPPSEQNCGRQVQFCTK